MHDSSPLHLWHLTSLDAPTVAVVWCLSVAWIAEVRLPILVLVTLALAAWTFYAGDRLLDSYRSCSASSNGQPLAEADQPLRPRHRFHWDHRRVLLPLCLAAAASSLALASHSMPPAARSGGWLLAGATAAYFAAVHIPVAFLSGKARFRLPKELLVAMVFSLACALPAWSRSAAEPERLILPVLLCTALAWLNCHAIESWESPLTRGPAIWRLALTLAAIALALSGAEVSRDQTRPGLFALALAASAALLAVLDRLRPGLEPTTLRALADLVLLTPAALLWLP